MKKLLALFLLLFAATANAGIVYQNGSILYATDINGFGQLSDLADTTVATSGVAMVGRAMSLDTAQTVTGLKSYTNPISGSVTGTSANITGIAAIANGGTGSATQNFVDLSNPQDIGGAKNFTGAMNTAKLNASGIITSPAGFTDGYITLGLAQINRPGYAVEMQYSSTVVAGTAIRFFGATFPIKFDGTTGGASFTGNIVSAGQIHGAIVVTANATIGATTLTGASMVGGVITRSGSTAAYTDTTDTATAIIAAIPNAGVGTSFNLRIANTVAFVDTIAGGVGVTLAGTTPIAASTFRDFVGVITSVSTVTLTGTGSGSL